MRTNVRLYTRIGSLLLLVASGLVAQSTFAAGPEPAYQVRSIYLQSPEKVIAFMTRSAEFWKKTYDPQYGGFFSLVGRDGAVREGSYKSLLSQSRLAYAFARAYMVTGNVDYLQYARYALRFIYSYGRDTKHGGFHTCLSRDGKSIDDSIALYAINSNQYNKWSFTQHYALLGIAAMVDATRNDDDFAFLTKARTLLDAKLWDETKGFEGYYEVAKADWSNPVGKGFNATVDGITTHGLAMYLLTGDARYKARFIELADGIINHIYPTMQARKLGFEEHFDSSWKEDNNSLLFIGHVLKTAWCLQMAYLISHKPEYKAAAERMMKQVWEKAWDHEYGGPFQYGNSILGSVTSRDKNYWTVGQAIMGGLISYHVTDNPLYLEMADKAALFFAEYLIDEQYGELFDTITDDGQVQKATDKGSYWKSGYHSMETGYYIYTYGNLYLNKRPVVLHYWIDRSTRNRVLSLTPIATDDSALIISNVTYGGKPYSDFDGKERKLSVPAGLEGEFKVTYAVVGK